MLKRRSLSIRLIGNLRLISGKMGAGSYRELGMRD